MRSSQRILKSAAVSVRRNTLPSKKAFHTGPVCKLPAKFDHGLAAYEKLKSEGIWVEPQSDKSDSWGPKIPKRSFLGPISQGPGTLFCRSLCRLVLPLFSAMQSSRYFVWKFAILSPTKLWYFPARRRTSGSYGLNIGVVNLMPLKEPTEMQVHATMPYVSQQRRLPWCDLWCRAWFLLTFVANIKTVASDDGEIASHGKCHLHSPG